MENVFFTIWSRETEDGRLNSSKYISKNPQFSDNYLMAKPKYKSLFLQLSVIITLFIFLIEGILLVVSFQAKKRELTMLDKQVKQRVFQQHQINVVEPLGENYISNHLNTHAKNIIWLTLLIVGVVVIGTLVSFYFVAGKHIRKLIEFNQNISLDNPIAFPEDNIPANEIGTIITTENTLIAGLKSKIDQLNGMATFSQHNPGPVFRLNAQGKVMICNKASEGIFSTHVPFVEQNWTERLENLGIMDLKLFIHSAQKIQVEVKQNDHVLLMDFVGVPEFNVINAYGTDITKLRKLLSQVFQSSKLASIGQLAAGVGHEINNPLAIIRGYLELFKEGNGVEDPEKLEIVENSVDRIVEIVDGLRSFSRADSDRVEVLNMNLIVTEALNMIRIIYEKQGIKIKSELSTKDILFKGHHGRFQQVVVNLLVNARDASNGVKAPQLDIKTYLEGETVVCSVEDNGCGIQKNKIKNIFDAFYTTKDPGQGTGLGLSISSNLINEMGGKIEVKSNEGVGTKFTIYLPSESRDSLHAKKSQDDSEQVANSQSTRILLVEDEQELGELIALRLSKRGFIVSYAENVNQAFELLEKESFDLIFSDAQMPDTSGVEFFLKLKEGPFADIPFVLATGSDPKKLLAESNLKGYYPDGTITKPYRMNVVVSLINELIVSKVMKKIG